MDVWIWLKSQLMCALKVKEFNNFLFKSKINFKIHPTMKSNLIKIWWTKDIPIPKSTTKPKKNLKKIPHLLLIVPLLVLHLHINLSLQYDLLWSSSSPSSVKHSLQFPQIKVSGVPETTKQKKKINQNSNIYSLIKKTLNTTESAILAL